MPESARSVDTGDISAPVISGNPPGSFAWGVLAKRHPALIQQVRDAFPYPPPQHRALDELLANITEGVLEPLGPGAPDADIWNAWARPHLGRSWFDVPFLWAESWFYRKLLIAVGYFEPGPWQGIDPFGPFKQAELSAAAVDDELAALDDLAARSAPDQDTLLLHASLWGNRADLGFRISSGIPGATGRPPGASDTSRTSATSGSAGTGSAAPPPLVADDSALLWSLLPPSSSPGSTATVSTATVCLIADNAAQELVPDLVLIDHLLTHGRAGEVVLHVKPYPYFVSDATTPDVVDALRRMSRAPGRAGETGRRLWAAAGSGRLSVRAHPFFCTPFPYSDMPEDLRQDFAGAALTIFKGDLNYRRLVGDRLWPATTSFTECAAYFPSPVAALRTLKSDVITGLDQHTVTALEAAERGWRTSGTHALVQARA